MGKKGRCVVFESNNDHLFPEKYTVKFFFPQKARVNTERVPPGHTILLLKSNKFNLAAVSVKRTIAFTPESKFVYPKHKFQYFCSSDWTLCSYSGVVYSYQICYRVFLQFLSKNFSLARLLTTVSESLCGLNDSIKNKFVSP